MFDIAIDNSTQPAKVAAIDNWPDPRPRIKNAWATYYQMYRTLSDEISEAGLAVHGHSSISRMHSAGHHLAELWERHASRLERALLALVAIDALSGDQRAEVIALMYGKKNLARDQKPLSDMEGQLVRDYRVADPNGKVMLRTMAKLAAAAAAEGVAP